MQAPDQLVFVGEVSEFSAVNQSYSGNSLDQLFCDLRRLGELEANLTSIV